MRQFQALAFDFGASTGRAILGTLRDGELSYWELCRFDNVPIQRNGCLCWDVDALMDGVREGVRRAGSFDSLAFDTWGVDFGLLDGSGALLSPPVHYRDDRTAGLAKRVSDALGAEELYRKTGTQTMDINTLFQLLALKEQRPELLERAETLLFMPDLLAYLLSGAAVCERTIASTSQMLDPERGVWRTELLESLGLPARLLRPVVPSGTVTAELPGGAKVVAAAGHDTQCAAAAAPLSGGDEAFLSCGTWSLLGTELDGPILTPESAALGLSNETGADGRTQYLKNIIGLWLIQESRRQWRREGTEYSFSHLEELALGAEPFRCFIDPDAPLFTPPGDLPERIRRYCRETGQSEPLGVGGTVRCIYESLALKYRLALEQLARMTGKRFTALHIVGGGAQARLLCRMAASSCGVPVEAGPVEATALGNLLVQWVALGALPDLAAGRRLIAKSERPVRYEPEEAERWNRAYGAFLKIINRGTPKSGAGV
ncbi:rhamnulokinase family protein [uncultured Oscillibacter sp.]|uniref:rhamnulokinase n=1 Tax=uncultured Oscillibacter sp. TaxID=876091 RepID=UPI0026240AB7|nr:rhamnulokinase family protein [uncultured Oscillibacter sp.]